jgi:hypothetical protein
VKKIVRIHANVYIAYAAVPCGTVDVCPWHPLFGFVVGFVGEIVEEIVGNVVDIFVVARSAGAACTAAIVSYAAASTM